VELEYNVFVPIIAHRFVNHHRALVLLLPALPQLLRTCCLRDIVDSQNRTGRGMV